MSLQPASPDLGQLIITLDPNGGLYLHVGTGVEEKTTTYLVCSTTLARASKFIQKILYGGFAEALARPSSSSSSSDHSDDDAPGWTVDLPEDRHKPMDLILNIVNGAFDKVPEELQLTELYALLVITERYDAMGITRPRAKG